MKGDNNLHTTNYFDTFILVADDCPATTGEVPSPKAGNHTAASLQFELIKNNPYKYTSEDVLFLVFAQKNNLAESEYEEACAKFYSRGQACFRASPLTKRYGWGLHFDSNGKVALYAMETDEYQKFLRDPGIKKIKAVRSSRR